MKLQSQISHYYVADDISEGSSILALFGLLGLMIVLGCM